MIEIICDCHCLYSKGPDDIEIDRDEQYEPCVEAIRQCSESCRPLKILVRNKGMFRWFDHCEKRYGCQILTISPRNELSRLLKQPLHDLMDDPKRIISHDLLTKAEKEPIRSNETSRDWLYRVLLGDVWAEKKLEGFEGLNRLMRLLWKSSDDFDPYLNKLVRARIDQWARDSGGLEPLLHWLGKEPVKRAWYLGMEMALSSYPPDRVSQWLQHDRIWGVLSKLKKRNLYVDQLEQPLTIKFPVAVSNLIRNFLKKLWEDGRKTEMLSHVSGRLDFEVGFLNETLTQRIFQGKPIANDLWQALASLKTDNRKYLELISYFKPMEPPDKLGPDASVDEMRLWIKNKYLPFYRHCSLFQQIDQTQDAVASFQIWLKKRYTKLLVDGKAMAYRKILSFKEQSGADPILFIVVDGLDFLTAEKELAPGLIERGLFPQGSTQPFLSFIPSETPLSKPALLGGKMPSQLPDEKPTANYYKSLVKNTFGLDDDHIRAATDKDMTIEELVNEPARLYLFLENQLDAQYLHGMYSPYARMKKYAEFARQLAVRIYNAAIDCSEVCGRDPVIVICSDHGYTELPKNQTVSMEGEGMKSRSLALTEESTVPESVWSLQKDLFGLPRKMAIPLGYGYFGKQPKGASHGGCTPQEMAVPWMVFSKSKPKETLPVSVIIEGEIHRGRKDNPVKISISNPNPYEIRLLELIIDECSPLQSSPLTIAAESFEKIDFVWNAFEVRSNTFNVSCRYKLESFSEVKAGEFMLTIETTGAMASDFDDEFDDLDI